MTTQVDDSQILQKKLYFLLEQLQNMARDLPPWVIFVISGNEGGKG